MNKILKKKKKKGGMESLQVAKHGRLFTSNVTVDSDPDVRGQRRLEAHIILLCLQK